MQAQSAVSVVTAESEEAAKLLVVVTGSVGWVLTFGDGDDVGDFGRVVVGVLPEVLVAFRVAAVGAVAKVHKRGLLTCTERVEIAFGPFVAAWFAEAFPQAAEKIKTSVATRLRAITQLVLTSVLGGSARQGHQLSAPSFSWLGLGSCGAALSL